IEKIMMWALGKIRESMESLPLELSRHVGKSEEDVFLPSKARLSYNMHNNILTPDKIPEFCLPPRLCKRSPLLEADTVAPDLHGQKQTLKNSTSSNTAREAKDVETKSDALVAVKAEKKPLPFSADGYDLAGIYESLNTRRKESLFHSKCPVYILDRSNTTAAPRLAKESNLPKKTLSGFLPHSLCQRLSKAESRESETPSSCSPTSPNTAKSPIIPSGNGLFKGATSCPSLIGSGENRGRGEKGISSSTASPGCPPSLEGSSLTFAPSMLFPLDVLQSQERAQREHILPLQGHVQVRLFVEHTISANMFSSQSTVRVRVVSVEWKDADRRTFNCAVKLCLTPGKLQPQESTVIRNCCSPAFNEDFFFTQLSREELLELQLRLRVVNKPATGTLRRRKVIGAIDKPLSQLLSLKNG
uniref:C2 domain-containing protein n=1 Tax=Mola mola TaxID=94237 RepID=A0A3Q4BDI5_MOLML